MAPAGKLVIPVVVALLVVLLESPTLEAKRFGSKAKTLHLHSSKRNDDLGDGYVRIRRSEEQLNSPDGEDLNRERRQAPTEAPISDKHDKAKVTKYDLDDNHPELIVHWAGQNSDMIVCLTRDIDQTLQSDSNVYFSNDYGQSFQKKTDLALNDGTKPIFDRFYHSPANNMRYLFVDTLHQQIFSTTNGGATFISSPSPAKMTTISMHKTDPNIVLGMDENDHSKRLYKSENFGASWEVIQSDVKSFWWGDTVNDKLDTLYVERIELTGRSTVVMSEHYFDYDHREEMIINNVIDFELHSNYLFATKYAPTPIDRRRQARDARDNRPRLDLYVSHNRGRFGKASFPTELDSLDFYIADAAEDQVFVCVNHDRIKTNLYISEIAGLRFSLSLENIVYYSPSGPGNDTWLSRFADKAFVDLHEVEGLRGIYIASQFNTTKADFEESNMLSVITYDKGGEWNLLNPPMSEEKHCEPPQCSLHLSQRFSQYYPGSRSVPILSKESAPGMIMGSGTMGSSLGVSDGFNVFKSSSAGATWYQVLEGPHYFSFGDHGGVLAAVSQYGSTNVVKYSVTEGEGWTTEAFNEEKIVVYGMMTEPGEKTTTFTVFGSLTQKHSWLIVQIDMKEALGPDCTVDDYKSWWPGEEFSGSRCLLGSKMVFERRIAHAVCFNGQDYDRPISVQNCSCFREDFECDFGYMEFSDWQTNCYPDPESDFDPFQIPSPCPEGTFYRRTKGYRKVEGDMCSGGEEYIWEADMVPCPIREMPEFLLYARRTEIHRFLLNSNRDEKLNLGVDLQAAIALDFDWHNNCLYWADIVEDTIHKFCLDNGNHTLIVDKSLETVEGLAFDWLAMNLYWVDSGLNKIEVARHDGRFRRTLINETLDKPRAITLDPKRGVMYWTDWGNIPHIRKSDMDGHNPTFLISTNIHWPNGITIDDQTQTLYWTDAYLDRIERCQFDGSFRRVLLSENVPHPYAIGIYKNDMYWDDWSEEAILKANKFTGGQMVTVLGNLSGVMDLKVFHNASQQGNNPCKTNNGGCTHLCLAVPGANPGDMVTRNCLCPDDFLKQLGADGSEICICDPGETLMPNGDCRTTGTTCEPDQFLCANLNCIPMLWRCDRDNDCGDLSDELNCPYEECHSDELKCANSGHCIPLSWRCDGDNDCGDMSDEPDSCTFSTCASSAFTCANHRCIPQSWVCDQDNDCHDGSDEAFCTTTTMATTPFTGNCSTIEFTCPSGRCIPRYWVCDGDNDCGDMADESNCGHRTCNPFQFECSFNSTCIPEGWQCDGMIDCDDGSDEQSCSTGIPTMTTWSFGSCSSSDFLCWNGQCVFASWKCDGIRDCSDGSDEYDCMTDEPTSAYTTCGPYQFHCPNGVCIPESWQCDGDNDCGDFADEMGCSDYTTTASTGHTCDFWQVPCGPGSSVDCISSGWVCDGDNDCGNGSDEENCPTDLPTEPPLIFSTVSSCLPSYFMCANHEKCIPQVYHCNGFYDCEDTSDEMSCYGTTIPTTTSCSGFRCLSGGECLPSSKVCDGRLDCYDGSDENNCDVGYHVSSFDANILSDTSVRVVWSPPNPLPSSSYQYVLTERQQFAGGSEISNTEFVSSSANQHIWRELTPGATYGFSIRVKVGTTLYKPEDYISLTLPVHVPGVPRVLQVHLHGESAVQVEWLAPTAAATMDITGYQVWYKEVDLWPGSTPRYVYLYGSRTSAIIENLRPHTTYQFKVAARNAAGTGPYTVPVNISTSTDPSQDIDVAPVNLSSDDASDDTVLLKWEKPDTSASILYYLIYCGRSDSLDISRLCGNTTRVQQLVNKLCPGSNYYFSVKAANLRSQGPMSSTVTATTKGVALTAPTNLQTRSMSYDSISLSWTYPQGNQGVTKFDIYYDLSGLRLPLKDVTTKNPYLVTGLLSGEEYVFQVSPDSDSCRDPPRSATAFGTTNYDETLPCRSLERKSSDLTTVTVMWKSPRDRPESLGYIVTYFQQLASGETGPSSDVIVLVSMKVALNATITGLIPGAMYHISVKTDVSDSKSIRVTATTDLPAAPTELHAVAEENNYVSLSWQKSLNPFNESLGYTVFMSNVTFDNATVVNRDRRNALDGCEINVKYQKSWTPFVPIWNGTGHFYRMSPLPAAKTFVFRVSTYAYKGYYGKMSADACVTTYGDGGDHPGPSPRGPGGKTTWIAGIAAAGALILLLAVFLVFFIVRHRRLQRSFMSFANSHYDPRSGTATFSNDEDNDLGDEEDQPMIRGFSDDEPLVVA